MGWIAASYRGLHIYQASQNKTFNLAPVRSTSIRYFIIMSENLSTMLFDQLAFFADSFLLPIWVYSSQELDIALDILEEMFLCEYPDLIDLNNVNNEFVWLQNVDEFIDLQLQNISDYEF